ncbi:MAG: hypothetical protein OEO23_07730 [Gemmatimonadota bacterium]|nr:hypothetical protein [Gemmatimonadota bacterium]
MWRLAVCMAVCGVLGTEHLWAQAFTTERAYHRDHALWFVAPEQVGWEELAPEPVRDLPIPTSDPTIVGPLAPEMDMWSNVEFRTTVALPADLAARRVYFVGAEGVRPLRIDSTHVVTRLELNPSGTRLVSRRSWGEVFGATEVPADGGGFVLFSDRSLSFAEERAEFSADDLFLDSGVAASGPGGEYRARGTAFWDIAAQYRFSVAEVDGEWLFVQWVADRENQEGGCAFRYDLLELEAGSAVRRLRWNNYGCDV